MITRFETPQRLEPENPGHVQWGPALLAGLVAGVILLFVPRGSPWSSMTFFDPLIMGRGLSLGTTAWRSTWVMHVALSLGYGLIVALSVARLKAGRAVLAGGLLGLALYGANLLLVSWLIPNMLGNEISVLFTHIVFGLIAAGVYRGLLRRRGAVLQPSV